jgi:hypothetical protein
MQCALCKLNSELRNSHIVPEFIHRPVYDDKHRSLLFGHGESNYRTLQKGLRERLLCDDCEQRIQKFEDYFAQYWYQSHPIPRRIEDAELHLKGFDYHRFKLLMLSIVWRASVSELPEYATVSLGPHEEPIRKMILDGNPGTRNNYPIFAGLIVDPETREHWDQVILSPLRIRVGPHWACRMVFGGASWTVITSSHQTLPLQRHFLTEAGELGLTIITLPEFARVTGLVQTARSLNNIMDRNR